MFSKCANLECSTSFDYEEGKFFRFHRSRTDGEPPPNTHSVQHFWLCGPCSQSYTLEYQNDRGVLIRPRLTHSPGLKTSHFIAAA